MWRLDLWAFLTALTGLRHNAFNTENAEKSEETTRTRRQRRPARSAAAGESEDSKEPAFLKKKRAAAEKHAMNLKPGEVVVGRRLYRSGQSEYLINGRVARLRDIQDLFMGIGLGPDSYAIIEQGRIGQILSSKPTDRRAIIEEAAGITKFKTKRRLSEAKLESSKVNLSRSQRYLRRSRKAAGIPEAASLEGSPVRRNPRTDARLAAASSGEQGEGTRS